MIITNENKIYLEEIANRLQDNHASIMIGSGFSKNAILNTSSIHGFSDWNQLGDAFIEKLYGKNTDVKKDYLNVLKLAEEVEATFGRNVLDDLLKKYIPDMEATPSNLHTKLLYLQWTDVFTTNYDTLLERAAKRIFNRKYTVVLSKEDLISASKPRIVKLHGSFPSVRPFIITEEDYRKYPIENATFVNTVQQSLLENTLCLIGFSGDDPNFLSWIGWIRDNLKNCASKIYLIGVFKFSKSQESLLEKRNIKVLNFNDGSDNNHYEALESFIDFLSEKEKKSNYKLWPHNPQRIDTPDFFEKDISEKITKITEQWREERKSYPGWEILPQDKRKYFFEHYTENWINVDLKKIKTGILLSDFLYELVWRLEKSLYPLPDNIANSILDILENFKEISNERKFFFSFAILKYLRHKGDNEKWEELYNAVLKYPFLNSEEKGELDYECALYNLFNLNYIKLQTLTKTWSFPDNVPFQNVKKASIIAEMGQPAKAIKIIEKAISAIQTQENLSTNRENIKLFSQEAYALNLYQNLIFINYEYRKTQTEKRNENQERTLILSTYLCNAENELQFFKNKLSTNYKEEISVEKKFNFEIGEQSKTIHFGKSYKEQKLAYAFLLFCEKIGLPFIIHSSISLNICMEEAKASMQRIKDYNFIWMLAVFCRTAELKNEFIDVLFDRESIRKFKSEALNSLCSNLIDILVNNDKELAASYEDWNFANTLAHILPEIISRLVTKCNLENKKSIIALLKLILSSPNRNRYGNIFNLIKRLIKSLSDEELKILINDIVCLPIPSSFTFQDENKFYSPLYYLQTKITKVEQTKINDELLMPYFDGGKSLDKNVRQWSCTTLISLFNSGFLSNYAIDKLVSILWSQIDSYGFPNNLFYYYSYYLELPFPTDKDLNPLMKEYLNEFKPINFIKGVSFSIKDIYVYNNYFEELENCMKISSLKFTEEEICLYSEKVISLWSMNNAILSNKKYLEEPFLAEEVISFKFSCYKMIHCLFTLLNKVEKISNELDLKIKKILQELKENNFSVLLLESLFLDVETYINLVIQNFSSKDPYYRNDALNTCEVIIGKKNIKNELIQELFDELLLSIIYSSDDLISNNINCLISLINENNIKFLNENLLIRVVLNLGQLSNIENEKETIPFVEKICIRKNFARLLFHIGSISIENDLLKTRIESIKNEILSDNEEFAEIKKELI